MKLPLLLCAVVAFSLNSTQSFASQSEEVSAVTGIYKLTFDSANDQCPKRIRVSQMTEDSLTFTAIGAQESLVIEDGEKDKIKLSTKESYQIKGSFEYQEARLEGRHCKGKVFKKCDDWQVLAMIDFAGEELMISHRASPYMPRSGFPDGTCSYVRGL